MKCDSPAPSDVINIDTQPISIIDDEITEAAHIDTVGRHSDQAKRSRDYRTSARSSSSAVENRLRHFNRTSLTLFLSFTVCIFFDVFGCSVT